MEPDLPYISLGGHISVFYTQSFSFSFFTDLKSRSLADLSLDIASSEGFTQLFCSWISFTVFSQGMLCLSFRMWINTCNSRFVDLTFIILPPH